VYLHDAKTHVHITIADCPFDRQVSSMVHIFNTSGKAFSAVEHLSLGCAIRYWSPADGVRVADRTEWRKILRSVYNVKTLEVHNVLVEELSRCLRFAGGEDPLELLPELQELRVTYSWRSNLHAGDSDAFASFIDTRQNAGRPVTLIYERPWEPIY
jgi:hypothetical protein